MNENNDIDDQEDQIDINQDVNEIIEEIVTAYLQENDDCYVHEATDANLDAGYFASPSNKPLAESVDTYHYYAISIKELK